MAKGARAPSQHAYRGSLGRTGTRMVHVTTKTGDLVAATVTTSIDAVSDPDLVERLHNATLNIVDGIRVDVPVLYHDPAAELLVLVLCESDRHRELDERIRVLEALRDDQAPVPAYAKELAVVFGPSGLADYLEKRAGDALKNVEASRELERRRHEISAREAERDRARADLERTRVELAELTKARVELADARAELERIRAAPVAPNRDAPTGQVNISTVAIASTRYPADGSGLRTIINRPPPAAAAPMPAEPDNEPSETSTSRHILVEPEPAERPSAVDFDEPKTSINEQHEREGHTDVRAVALDPRIEIDDEPTASAIVQPGADPLLVETHELPLAPPDGWLGLAMTGAASSFSVSGDTVRLALIAPETVARGLGGDLDVRLLLHRMPTAAVVTVVIGLPAALRTPIPSQVAVVPLDVGVELDREVLVTLAKGFELRVDLIKRNKLFRSVSLVGPLADNAAYVLRAAEDHVRELTSDGSATNFERGRDAVLAPDYDLLGAHHVESGEFRDDKLGQIETAMQLRRAVAMARRFARPAREDYLACTRGYSLQRWHELRRAVVERAVMWGIWMGPELAQVAVSEGLARSRRDLVVRLDAGFDALHRHPTAFDIDQDAADDNLAALAEEAKAMGVELRKSIKNGAIGSDDVPIVSGSIERTPTSGIPRGKSVDELVAMLEDRTKRVSAALELCERADPRAAEPVISLVTKLSRAEAVRVLGTSVRFGPAAAPPLLEGLKSSKAFLRHGCALALAMLRTEDGTQAVIELLCSEPTEIWREIARAVGQVGPNALMPLAAHAGRLGERMTPALVERVAWAMAHIGVRGAKPALEALAAGHSVVAPIARKALELVDQAAQDHTIVRNGHNGAPQGDVTVNRAFSRRFFEAFDAISGQAPPPGRDMSTPMELLDADLLDDEELDESDLIQQ